LKTTRSRWCPFTAAARFPAGTGEEIPVPFAVAQEVGSMRRQIAEILESIGRAGSEGRRQSPGRAGKRWAEQPRPGPGHAAGQVPGGRRGSRGAGLISLKNRSRKTFPFPMNLTSWWRAGEREPSSMPASATRPTTPWAGSSPPYSPPASAAAVALQIDPLSN